MQKDPSFHGREGIHGALGATWQVSVPEGMEALIGTLSGIEEQADGLGEAPNGRFLRGQKT